MREPLPNNGKKLKPVHVWHLQVRNYEIRERFSQDGKSSESVFGALNRPIRLITRQKILREAKHYYFPVGIFFRRRQGSASGSGLGRSMTKQSPAQLRFYLSHFPSRRARSKSIGTKGAPRLSCGDALIAATIRLSVTDAVASRRTMNITAGLRSG